MEERRGEEPPPRMRVNASKTRCDAFQEKMDKYTTTQENTKIGGVQTETEGNEEDRTEMNSKNKGNRGELELLHILQEAGIRAARNQQMYIGGFMNPDIGAEVRGLPLHIEVKRREKLSVYEAMKQATRDAGGMAIPVVAYRKNNEDWLCVLRLEDILPLIAHQGGTQSAE